MMNQKSRIGFTLIELLIVVAIIAILAAIAVPNFLEAQVRSKVSRARADMRTIATALEAYAVDNNKYVWVRSASPGYAIPAGPDPAAGLYGNGLTTPIAYIAGLLKDAFGGKNKPEDLYSGFGTTEDFWYATREYYEDPLRNFPWNVYATANPGSKAAWVLMSKGPDLAWARNPPLGPGADEVDYPNLWQYDPTNGTVSSGNIVRVGP